MSYYYEMLRRERLIPIVVGDRLAGCITFYIGSSDNIDKYVRDNPWSVLDDEPETGDVCFIDQLITDKVEDNYKHSFQVFKMIIEYIKQTFPQVEYIRWNRHNIKTGEPDVYYKGIRR